MNRSLLLAGLLGATLSGIYLLPPFNQAECALDIDLPARMGAILLQEYPPSEKELKILAKDTKFAKARCGIPRTEERSYITGETPYDVVELSVVLSGYDLANSIHRPERCMPSQGHKIFASEKSELALSDGRSIPVTRLLSTHIYEVEVGGLPQQVSQNCITYYFFVGHDEITASHTERTLIDIRDRVLKGEAQRWAYVSSTIAFQDQEDPPPGAPPTQSKADQKVRELLARLAESNLDWNAVGS